jgi:hypothetical protein
MAGELHGLRVAASHMLQLEAELEASTRNLTAMNKEVERARAASSRIE